MEFDIFSCSQCVKIYIRVKLTQALLKPAFPFKLGKRCRGKNQVMLILEIDRLKTNLNNLDWELEIGFIESLSISLTRKILWWSPIAITRVCWVRLQPVLTKSNPEIVVHMVSQMPLFENLCSRKFFHWSYLLSYI